MKADGTYVQKHSKQGSNGREGLGTQQIIMDLARAQPVYERASLKPGEWFSSCAVAIRTFGADEGCEEQRSRRQQKSLSPPQP